MAPFLRAGDRVGVEWLAEGSSPTFGEIVVARAETDDWIVHRVIDSSHLRLKGDLSSAFEALSSSRIFGRVITVQIGPRTFPYRRTWLDDWIARISARTLSPSRTVAFLARRGTRLLGRTRRLWLKVTST